MRRVWALTASTVAAASLVVGLVGAATSRPTPSLTFRQDVPADVRRLTEHTWRSFLERFAARATCLDDVSIELVRSVDDGDARYVIADTRIEIQIPTTPARYRESLVHELAHHVERTCPAFESLRATLAPLVGGTADTWFSGPTWATIPSERYAEAVVELVNGERIRHAAEVGVDAEIVALLRRWAGGERLVTTSAGVPSSPTSVRSD